MTNGVDDSGDPSDIRVGDRRAQPRESVVAAVRLHLDPETSEPCVLEGTVADLSTRGIQVVTSKYWLSPHEPCIVELVDADEGLSTGRITGFVRWAMQDDPGESVFGIEFEEPLSGHDPEG